MDNPGGGLGVVWVGDLSERVRVRQTDIRSSDRWALISHLASGELSWDWLGVGARFDLHRCIARFWKLEREIST